MTLQPSDTLYVDTPTGQAAGKDKNALESLVNCARNFIGQANFQVLVTWKRNLKNEWKKEWNFIYGA